MDIQLKPSFESSRSAFVSILCFVFFGCSSSSTEKDPPQSGELQFREATVDSNSKSDSSGANSSSLQASQKTERSPSGLESADDIENLGEIKFDKGHWTAKAEFFPFRGEDKITIKSLKNQQEKIIFEYIEKEDRLVDGKGELVLISDSRFASPLLLTHWMRGIGRGVLRIFDPGVSAKPIFECLSGAEEIEHQVKSDHISISFQDPEADIPAFSEEEPPTISFDWPLKKGSKSPKGCKSIPPHKKKEIGSEK